MSGRHTLRRLLVASAVGLAGMLAVPWVPAADAAVLVSIDVTPSPANVPIGVTTQFTATGHYTDLSSADITTSVTWTSSVPSAATVNDTGADKGKVTGVALGATTITATSGLISGSSLVTVVPAELVTITVDPLLASIPKGTTQQYTATGHYTDLSTQDLTTHVVWSSSLTTVASISNANGSRGLATGVGIGATVITATDAATSIAGVAGLGVTAPVLVAINISPPASSVTRGGSEQLTAEGVYSDLTTAPLTDLVTWSSLFPANATVSDTVPTKGLVTGVAVGGTTISATDPATSIVGVATVAVTPFIPLPQIYISDEAVNEPPAGGTATATFTIELSAPSAVPVTVTASSSNGTAAAGSDYNALLPTLVTFTPGGPLTQTVSVTINGDDFRERNENFIVRLQSPVGATLGDDTGVGRILDPLGRFTVFVRDAQVVQSPTALTTAHFAVELNAAPLPGETVTVQVATADLSAKVADNDYAALGPITLTFDSTTGNSIDVPVTVRKSTPGEGTEQFMLVASSPSPNLQISDSFGVGAIYNGSIPSFPSITIQDPRVVEPFSGTATLTYRIRLSKPTSQTVKVTYATTNDGTATPGIDYVPIPPTVLTFLPNETQKLVNVTVNGDAFHERVETVKLTLSGSVNAVIGDTQGVGRIRDQLGRFAVYVRDASVTQSSTSTTTARFVVSLSATPLAGESVSVAVATVPFTATAVDGDYVPLSQDLTFGPGVSNQSVDVTVNAGPASEADEFFALQLVSSSLNAKIADAFAAGNISAGA